jgi:hypothetical protein
VLSYRVWQSCPFPALGRCKCLYGRHQKPGNSQMIDENNSPLLRYIVASPLAYEFGGCLTAFRCHGLLQPTSRYVRTEITTQPSSASARRDTSVQQSEAVDYDRRFGCIAVSFYFARLSHSWSHLGQARCKLPCKETASSWRCILDVLALLTMP